MTRQRHELDAQVKKMLSTYKSEEEKVPRYLRIGNQYFLIREYEEAEKFVKKYLLVKPQSHEANKLLGDIHSKQSNFQEAYLAYKVSYSLHQQKEVLASICNTVFRLPVEVSCKQDWLAKAEKANIPQSDMLSLKESILRELNSSTVEMETVLKEQAALNPLDCEVHVKLVKFYLESLRFEECVKYIVKEEVKQEMRLSLRWYKECASALQAVRNSKAVPIDQHFLLVHLHIASRLGFVQITDSSLISDEDNASAGRLQDFFGYLESFDVLLYDAFGLQCYKEGLWAFVLDHYSGQLLYLYALVFLKRAEESGGQREQSDRPKGHGLMFCTLEYRPKKVESEPWYVAAPEDRKAVLHEMYLDACYRTTTCFKCLANTSSESNFPERIKVAISGEKAIKQVTERLFKGQAISAVYNQELIGRACLKLPEKALMTTYEVNTCLKYKGSLEHLVWFMLCGIEIPTDRIFSTLQVTSDDSTGASTICQADVDAFLSSVCFAVKLFGAREQDFLKPTLPRELLQRTYSTVKQRNWWNAAYRSFVNKVVSGRDVVQMKKTLSEGLDILRGRDNKLSMPVLYLAQIARDLHKKGQRRTAYFARAAYYYKLVLSRLDDQSSNRVQPSLSGGRASVVNLFEAPRNLSLSGETAGLRDEARLEIGKYLLYSGEVDQAAQVLEVLQHPRGYLYYARAAHKLAQEYINENDQEMAEGLLDKARICLTKGISQARHDPVLVEKLKSELDSLDRLLTAPLANGSALNISGLSPKVDPVIECDFARMEAALKKQTDRAISEMGSRMKFRMNLVQAEVTELKNNYHDLKEMQQQLMDQVAKSLATLSLVDSHLRSSTKQTNEVAVTVAAMSQQVTRVEEMVLLQQASEYAAEYEVHTPAGQPAQQTYQSGGLVIPPGVGLPQFNLSSLQHQPHTTVQQPAVSPTPAYAPATAKQVQTKILFDSDGVLYEKRPGENYKPLGGTDKICVFEVPTTAGVLCKLWYFNSVTGKVLVEHDLNNHVVARSVDVNGSSNLIWSYNQAEYYVDFIDLSGSPGEMLRRVFENCGVMFMKPQLPIAQASPITNILKENPLLTAALGGHAKSSLHALSQVASSPATDVKPVLAPASSTTSWFGSQTTPKPTFGAFNPPPVTTPVTAQVSAAAATPTTTQMPAFSFNMKPSDATPQKPVATLGGFTFTTPAVVSPQTLAKDKTPEKPSPIKQEPSQPNPFSGFSFGPNKTLDKTSTPVFDTLSAGNTASGVPSPAFSFGTPTTTSTTAPSPPKPFTGFSFSTTAPQSTSSPAIPKPATTSVLTPSKPIFGATSAPAASQPAAKDDEVEEFEPNVDFKPVIDLPDLVDVKTGEEGETVAFSERAKLYRYVTETKEWKERGLGEMKVLRNDNTGKSRIVMRREQVLKLCANHSLVAGMKLVTRPKNTEFLWIAQDFTDGELKQEQLVIRFKTPEQANKFKKAFEDGVKACEASPAKGKASSKGESSEGVKSAESKPAASTKKADSFMDKFKPKTGSWECAMCLVNNSGDTVKCVACEALKPGAKASENPNPNSEVKTVDKFKFGFASASIAPAGDTTTSFLFGTGASSMASSTGTPSKAGFVFGQGSGAFGSGALATSPPKFAFGTPSTPAKEKEDLLLPAGGFTFGSPQKHEFSFEAKNDEEEDEVVESKDVHFTPVIPLPPVVDVVTGEEGLEVLYTHRAKLFRFFNKEWKERGTGNIKILRDPNTRKIRLTMRRDQVHKVCLNHYLTADITFKKKDDKIIEWNAVDFSKREPEPTLFAVRVKNKEIADELFKAIASAQAQSEGAPTSPSDPSRVQGTPEVVTTPQRPTATPSPSTTSTPGSFSFNLEDHKDLTPTKPTFSFLHTGKSLFGGGASNQEKEDDEVQVVKEEKATATDVERARRLMLPDNFFLYEQRQQKPCKGCRGCEEDDCQKTPEKEAVLPSLKQEVSPKPTPVFGKPASIVAFVPATEGKPLEKANLAQGGGFVFGEKEGPSFSDIAASNERVEFSFASDATNQNPWGGSQQKNYFSAFTMNNLNTPSGGATTASITNPTEAVKGAGDEDEVAPSVDIHFEPIVPMPELVDVKTGEEEDELLYSNRAKLYVFSGATNEWKERAVGEAKILKQKDGRARIVVRRDMVHKVACNHYITSDMTIAPLKTSNTSVTWSAVDFAEGEPTPVTFALRVKGAERLNEFQRVFNEERDLALQKDKEGAEEFVMV